MLDIMQDNHLTVDQFNNLGSAFYVGKSDIHYKDFECSHIHASRLPYLCVSALLGTPAVSSRQVSSSKHLPLGGILGASMCMP